MAALPVQAAQVEEIVIEQSRQPAYQESHSGLGKLTEPLADTPQSITALTEQLLQDRGAMSLNDALRNVPGITLGAGEFTWQGNNPTIRGFNSRNDMFIDGMRDYGSYERDPFALEAVEVLQGPSSMIFGRGSTGGVIEQTSKQPKPEAFARLHLNIGNADTQRYAFDFNQPLPVLGEHGGVRLNLLDHHGMVPGRDVGENDHWGVAPSLAMDLGDATLLSMNYLKQRGHSIPDYGLPWLLGAPAPVPSHNFYGFASDYLDTDTGIANVRVQHRFSPTLKLDYAVRHAGYERHSRISEPLIPSGVTAATPLDAITVTRNVFQGDSTEHMLQQQLSLSANLVTGVVEHVLVTGVEWATESSAPIMRLGVGVPGTSLLAPVLQPFSAARMQVRARADTTSNSLAGYGLDTLKFAQHWQLVLGARWDSFATDYAADRYDANGISGGTDHVQRNDIQWSWRAALVYKPVEAQTWYVGWGTSFNPSAEGLSFIANARNFGISNAFLEPEQNRSIEAGNKWLLVNGGLELDTAVFSIVKRNARVPDPNNPGFNALAGEQKVDGVSLTAAGMPLPGLSVQGGYTLLDSEEAKTAPGLDNQGRALVNVARDNFSLWLNYAFMPGVEAGMGMRYIGPRYARNTAPVNQAGGYWSFDASGKYAINRNLTMKLSLTNIGDALYYDQLHPFHVIPGPAFAGVLGINLDY